MKTAVVFFALIFGCITPMYSQLNRYRKVDAAGEHFQNKRYYDLGNLKLDRFGGFLRDEVRGNFNFENSWVGKSPDFLSDRVHDGLSMLSRRPTSTNFTEAVFSNGNMPCLHPRSGHEMPCLIPSGTFPMRVLEPKNVAWGILF